MAASENINPRDVNIKQLQKKLLQAGCYPGDENRLAKLGLRDE